MNERIMCMDAVSGDLRIISLDDAVSELCAQGLYSEIAPRLRGGESVQLPNGRRYQAVATLGVMGVDLLPPAAVS
ncbi:MAG TPA: hypothetical protein VKB51_12510 [bacterium]|nr:hypothetical protein [bacterium]